MTTAVSTALAKVLADLAATATDMTALQAVIAELGASTMPPASPSGATIDAIGAYLIDGSGNTWSLAAGGVGTPAQVITLNGTVVTSGQVILLLYFGGTIYQENSAKNWWSWVSGAWVAAPADPRAPVTPPAKPPVTPTGITAPTVASAAGHTKLIFDDEFTANTIQVGGSNRIGAGQKWVIPTSSPVGDLTKGGSPTVANSIATIQNLMQSVDYDGQNGFSLPRTGCYVEASIAFPASDSGDGAFWAMPRQWLEAWSGVSPNATQWPGAPAGFVSFCELDIIEDFFNQGATYQATIHEWSGVYANGYPGNAANFTPSHDGQNGGTNWENNLISTAGADMTKFNTFGVLYTPSVNGSQGSVQFTFNGALTGDRVTWVGPHPSYSGINPGTAPWTFSIIDSEDMFLFIGGQPGAGPATTMQVDWVRVWE